MCHCVESQVYEIGMLITGLSTADARYSRGEFKVSEQYLMFHPEAYAHNMLVFW